jgi:hypothetical protein
MVGQFSDGSQIKQVTVVRHDIPFSVSYSDGMTVEQLTMCLSLY